MTAEIGDRAQPAVPAISWRVGLAAAGAVLILLGYALPMFSERIVSATTTFTDGTATSLDFPVLISGQHFAQEQAPLNEELQNVAIIVEPLPGFRGAGYAWLARAAGDRQTFGRLLSFFVCLLIPLLGALGTGAMMGPRLAHKGSPSDAWIPPYLNVVWLAPFALVFAWLHQFDFSTLLLDRQPGALMPQAGFWMAVVGTVAVAVATWTLRLQTRRRTVTWWALVFAVALTIWLLARFKPQPYLEIWNFISDGILVTLQITVVSYGFILLVSLIGGLGRISRSKIIYGIASLYVELVRGIPLMVQLLFIWFALPQVFPLVGSAVAGISPGLASLGNTISETRLSAFAAAVVGLTLCYGAYGSEIFRAGISSIHHGQMEAARSLGMTYIQAMRHIVLPQAVRVILPPIGNEFVALLKDSALVSVLAVSDLTRRGREYMSRTFLSFDTWILVALCYLVLTLASSRAMEFIESKARFER
ncbi:MAG: amino acid ABC transporter permease [Anaerolineae bacterium]